MLTKREEMALAILCQFIDRKVITDQSKPDQLIKFAVAMTDELIEQLSQ